MVLTLRIIVATGGSITGSSTTDAHDIQCAALVLICSMVLYFTLKNQVIIVLFIYLFLYTTYTYVYFLCNANDSFCKFSRKNPRGQNRMGMVSYHSSWGCCNIIPNAAEHWNYKFIQPYCCWNSLESSDFFDFQILNFALKLLSPKGHLYVRCRIHSYSNRIGDGLFFLFIIQVRSMNTVLTCIIKHCSISSGLLLTFN